MDFSLSGTLSPPLSQFSLVLSSSSVFPSLPSAVASLPVYDEILPQLPLCLFADLPTDLLATLGGLYGI